MMSTLFERLCWAKDNLEPVQSDLRVVFDDGEPPAKVLVPDPNWMACALYGHILPPVEVYLQLEVDAEGRVLNGYTLHETTPVGPMTEEEAIEYLIRKDLPRRLWDRSNEQRFVICYASQLPDRAFRNAWRLNNG